MSPLYNNAFRAGVGAVLINQKGEVLAFERINIKDAWQFPQGGLEIDEKPLDAVYREITEETSILPQHLKHIDTYPEWLAYELDHDKQSLRTGRGQVQKWFLFEFIGQDKDINIKTQEPEFGSYAWMNMDKLIEKTISFRKPIYLKLKQYWKQYLKTEQE